MLDGKTLIHDIQQMLVLQSRGNTLFVCKLLVH